MPRFLRGLALVALVLLAGLAQAQKPGGVQAVTAVERIEEYRLANGLQLLLVPDDLGRPPRST